MIYFSYLFAPLQSVEWENMSCPGFPRLDGVKRGDFVTVALQGDFGKPRSALVIQSDLFDDQATVTVLLVSGTLVDALLLRVTVQPAKQNGLQKPSQVMIDKAMTVRRDRIGGVFGAAGDADMMQVGRTLAVFFGLA